MQAHRLIDAALVRAQRGEELADPRLFERIAGALLEQLQGAIEAAGGLAQIAEHAQRVALHRPGARAQVVDRRVAVDRGVDPLRDLDRELGELQRPVRIVVTAVEALFHQELGESPGMEAAAVAHQQQPMGLLLSLELGEQARRLLALLLDRPLPLRSRASKAEASTSALPAPVARSDRVAEAERCGRTAPADPVTSRQTAQSVKRCARIERPSSGDASPAMNRSSEARSGCASPHRSYCSSQDCSFMKPVATSPRVSAARQRSKIL